MCHAAATAALLCFQCPTVRQEPLALQRNENIRSSTIRKVKVVLCIACVNSVHALLLLTRCQFSKGPCSRWSLNYSVDIHAACKRLERPSTPPNR
jgi:hypothetical protein